MLPFVFSDHEVESTETAGYRTPLNAFCGTHNAQPLQDHVQLLVCIPLLLRMLGGSLGVSFQVLLRKHMIRLCMYEDTRY